MSLHLSRRAFLLGAAAAPFTGLAPARAGRHVALAATTRTIDVNGRAAQVLGLLQPDGTHGLSALAGDRFTVSLGNALDDATLIHWHGLTPPNAQDGVPDLTQPALGPGERYDYDFRLARPGTNWMHSHLGLQEQRLLAAPLVIRDPAEAGLDEQEVLLLLHDFTFRDPEAVFAELTAGMDHAMAHGGHGEEAADRRADPGVGAGAVDHAAMGHGADAAPPTPRLDLNDVEFDVYLANDRTLADPQVARVERGARVRLRVINAASATNFVLDLGTLDGMLIAVDGRDVQPVAGRSFPLAIAQRLDIRLRLPGAGAFPVLAVREGDTARTGIVLATPGAAIGRVAEQAATAAGVVDLALERTLSAREPLAARPADRRLVADLTGSMMGYSWGVNGARFGTQAPLKVRTGERVEILMRNTTAMSHPMHLHGHHFQVVAIDEAPLAGALRDTVLVPVGGSVTVAFDADNPGRWAFHCHNLYHMHAGMMTAVEYEG